MTRPARIQALISLIFVVSVAVGGFFIPYIGFAVALVMLVALIMTLIKPRSFCTYACPRGKTLGLALKPFSRGKPLPKGFATAGTRRALCGFMMVCVISSIVRLFQIPAALGTFFWSVCVISLLGGVALGLLYRPRAWCAVCPMATLQETIGGFRRPAATQAAGEKP